MSIPYTKTRLLRWRVRDWASCCRIPLDEEPDAICSSSPQLSHRNMCFNPQGYSRSHETNKKTSCDKKCNQEIELITNSTQNNNNAGEETDDPRWPSFAEEDYIVFCFRDDGGIHVVKSDASNRIDHADRSSRSINRKLTYSHEDMLNEDENDTYPTNEEESIIYDKKGKGKRNIYLNTIKEVEEHKECKGGSAESSDSNQSDASTSSFAFPVMSWEWMGSPVQMPKSKRLHLRRKNKPRSVRLQCCRF